VSEGHLIMKPTDSCQWCKQEFAKEELVMIESGQVLPMKKDPSKLRFYADWQRPPKEQPLSVVVKVFHFECFFHTMERLDLGWFIRSEEKLCAACDHRFKDDRWGFQYTVGSVGDGGDFEQDISIPDRPLMCSRCTSLVFGHGDEEAGDRRIHQHLEDDQQPRR